MGTPGNLQDNEVKIQGLEQELEDLLLPEQQVIPPVAPPEPMEVIDPKPMEEVVNVVLNPPHVPLELQFPLENFGVEDIMPDQLVDFMDHEGSPEHLHINFMHHASGFSMDPGWASFWDKQRSSCFNSFASWEAPASSEAKKLWRDFFAPLTWSDKVGNELLNEVHQKKGKGTVPVGRKQKLKAKAPSHDVDAPSEDSQ
ncbi:hypothetical protein BS78_01G290600 [Paspalum vaginatum]|nr:hypothetical protein BS78_01G290600 [Paspalum vaginatum]